MADSDDVLLLLDTTIQDLRLAIVALVRTTEKEIEALNSMNVMQHEVADAIASLAEGLVAWLAMQSPPISPDPTKPVGQNWAD